MLLQFQIENRVLSLISVLDIEPVDDAIGWRIRRDLGHLRRVRELGRVVVHIFNVDFDDAHGFAWWDTPVLGDKRDLNCFLEFLFHTT